MREICGEFPYWFMTVDPGVDVYADIPIPESTVPGWIDKGWFITEEGRAEYDLQVAVDMSTTESLIANCEASQIKFVKRFDLTGALLADLTATDPNAYLSWGNLQGANSTGVYKGAPLLYSLYTRDGNSHVRLNPIPDRKYLISISWDLAYPTWFQLDNGITNLMLMHYPRAVQCIVGMQYARWFKEAELFELYRKELYGDARGRVRSDIPDYGIIGLMKKDTNRRLGQDTQEIEWHASSRAATGRGGSYRRSPYDSYYIGPGNYQ